MGQSFYCSAATLACGERGSTPYKRPIQLSSGCRMSKPDASSAWASLARPGLSASGTTPCAQEACLLTRSMAPITLPEGRLKLRPLPPLLSISTVDRLVQAIIISHPHPTSPLYLICLSLFVHVIKRGNVWPWKPVLLFTFFWWLPMALRRRNPSSFACISPLLSHQQSPGLCLSQPWGQAAASAGAWSSASSRAPPSLVDAAPALFSAGLFCPRGSFLSSPGPRSPGSTASSTQIISVVKLVTSPCPYPSSFQKVEAVLHLHWRQPSDLGPCLASSLKSPLLNPLLFSFFRSTSTESGPSGFCLRLLFTISPSSSRPFFTWFP